MDRHSPGVVVCGEGFPSKSRIRFSFLFQAVFQPLQWVSNAMCTAGDLKEEDHLREVRVVHSNHMSNQPTDRIKGLCQVHKEDVQALILPAALSLIFPTANIMSIVPLFVLKAHWLSETKSSRRGCVIQLIMMLAMIFPGILNSEMPLSLSQDALSSLVLYRWWYRWPK